MSIFCVLVAVVQYEVMVELGQVNPEAADNEVYVCMYGDQGGTGKRLLKHSKSNSEKFKQKQVNNSIDLFLSFSYNILSM